MDTGERRSQTKLGQVATALAIVVLIVASCSGAATSAPASAAPTSAAATSAAPASAVPASAVPATGSKAAAQSIVAGFLGPVKFVSPGPAIDISKFKGKAIWIISADLSIPFHQNIIKGWEEAALAAGLTSVKYDGKGQQQEASRGVDQAIAAGAAGIALLSVSPTFQVGALQRAKDAGIPVIGMLTTSSEHEPWPGTAGEASYSYYKSGQLLAAYSIANNDGPVHGVFMDTSEYKEVAFEKKGYFDTFALLCAECTLQYADTLVGTMKQQAQTQTPVLLQRFPETNWFFPAYDVMATFVIPGIKEAGFGDKVRVASINAVNTNLQFILDGNVQVADAGIPNNWMGWAGVDSMLRGMVDPAHPVTTETPFRLFDKSNLNGVDVNSQDALFPGVDYRAEYKKLWGVTY